MHVYNQSSIKPAFQFKYGVQPHPRSNSNTEFSHIRVPTQTRISVRVAFQLKRGPQTTPRSNSNADLYQFCVSTQMRDCELRISTTEQNPRESYFYCNCLIIGSTNTHVIWGVNLNYREILGDNFTSEYPYK